MLRHCPSLQDLVIFGSQLSNDIVLVLSQAVGHPGETLDLGVRRLGDVVVEVKVLQGEVVVSNGEGVVLVVKEQGVNCEVFICKLLASGCVIGEIGHEVFPAGGKALFHFALCNANILPQRDSKVRAHHPQHLRLPALGVVVTALHAGIYSFNRLNNADEKAEVRLSFE